MRGPSNETKSENMKAVSIASDRIHDGRRMGYGGIYIYIYAVAIYVKQF
jgi:hypothetical protein